MEVVIRGGGARFNKEKGYIVYGKMKINWNGQDQKKGEKYSIL